MKHIKITIEGMHCASCANNIERSLKKVKGVKEAVVSMMTKKAFVDMEDFVSENEIKSAISRVGYKVLDMEQD